MPLVPGRLARLHVHAAARHDQNVRALADVEVVVDHVVDVAVRHARGDGHALALCAGLNADDEAGVVLLAVDLDVLGGAALHAATFSRME